MFWFHNLVYNNYYYYYKINFKLHFITWVSPMYTHTSSIQLDNFTLVLPILHTSSRLLSVYALPMQDNSLYFQYLQSLLNYSPFTSTYPMLHFTSINQFFLYISSLFWAIHNIQDNILFIHSYILLMYSYTHASSITSPQ